MNDWSLERLIAWRNELKICSMFFFEQLKRWKVERLNDWMLVQMHFFQCFITLTDWTIERLKDNGNLNIYFLWRFERLNDWRIMEIEMCSSNLKDGMIEGLKDWTIMEFKMYKIIFLKDWTIERLNDYGNLNICIFFARLKDWMIEGLYKLICWT